MRRPLPLAVLFIAAPAIAAAQPTIPPLPVPPVEHRTQPPLPVPPVEHGGVMPQRFYAIAASGPMARQDGWKMCMGGEHMKALMASLQDFTRSRTAKADLSKGCTHSMERQPDGTVVSAMTCDKAAGASHSLRMRSTFVANTLTMHTEIEAPDPAHPGADKTIVSDISLTTLGPCPAGMQGGQYLDRDGKLHDQLAEIEALHDRLKAAKPTP